MANYKSRCWWRSFKESEGEEGKREKRKERYAASEEKNDVLLFVDVDNCVKVIKEHIIVFFMLCLRRSAGIG
eukprot:scaffold7044_cov90-Skeletonema_dohrnii-CCMP3373.AAC.1